MRRITRANPHRGFFSATPRIHGAQIALALSLILMCGAASSETLKDASGRRLMTGKKLSQINVLGLEPAPAPSHAVAALPRDPGSQVLSTGRYLRTRPTQPVSVGLIGCPGCFSILEAISPVVVERRGIRRNTTRQR